MGAPNTKKLTKLTFKLGSKAKMAFRGVFEAPMTMGSNFGLLDCVKPETNLDENQWVRGFSQYWNSGIYSAKNLDDTDTTSYTIANNATPTRYLEVTPFFVEVSDNRSTLGLLGIDHIERIKLQLECITQKALEAELWAGTIRIGESHSNRALVDPAATILNSGTALSATRALALLEQSIGETSSCGIQGVIHMTRDVASLLINSNVLYHASTIYPGRKNTNYLTTLAGTPVVVGSGYSGAGPTDAAGDTETPTTTNKWMYATGEVRVILGDIDVVNDNLAQGYDVSGNANSMRIKAIRPVAVYFDSSVHLAIRVDLTA